MGRGFSEARQKAMQRFLRIARRDTHQAVEDLLDHAAACESEANLLRDRLDKIDTGWREHVEILKAQRHGATVEGERSAPFRPQMFFLGSEHTTYTTKAAARREHAAARKRSP